MHIIVSGCGRSGFHLAQLLAEAGVDLVVIDEKEDNLKRLEAYNLMTIQGCPVDTAVLEEAGIKDATAVIAIADQENLNIMCCEIASQIYGVKHTIARTYTTENEAFLREMGIATICVTALTVAKALKLLGFEEKK